MRILEKYKEVRSRWVGQEVRDVLDDTDNYDVVTAILTLGEIILGIGDMIEEEAKKVADEYEAKCNEEANRLADEYIAKCRAESYGGYDDEI